ncbi:MAG: IS3 family transposase [Deltaproteobacteria bacterium]|nr:IS3 family transposase [Deltaproteobacteria bacterium]
MEQLYQVVGISRQLYFKCFNYQKKMSTLYSKIKEVVLGLREDHPRMGARTLYTLMKLTGTIGINRFERFLSEEGLSLAPNKNAYKTTNSNHAWLKYENLLNGLKLTDVNQVWGSDITYFMVQDKVYYIVFIEDLYSRRILGYSANDNMFHQNNTSVLNASIELRKGADLNGLIHHSDKGSQYCSNAYIDLLNQNNMMISMANTSIENPYVERLNGTLKNDYLYPRNRVNDLITLRKELDIVVYLYNYVRPHSQLGKISPMEFERKLKTIPMEKRMIMELYNFEKR